LNVATGALVTSTTFALTSGAAANLPGIPNNTALRVAADVRGAGPSVLYDGISDPFTTRPGATSVVTLHLAPVPPPPETAVPGSFVFVRLPWGGPNGQSPGSTLVYAAPGTIPDGEQVAVYGSADSTAIPLGTFGPGGSAQAALGLNLGSGASVEIQGDRSLVYVGFVDRAGNPTATAPVHDFEWVATLNGKIPGDPASNPHSLFWNFAWRPQASAETIPFPLPQEPLLLHAPLVQGPGSTLEEPFASTFSGSEEVATAAFPWTPRTLASTPPARSSPVMVYDSTRAVTVLVGGSNGSSALGDTWEWSGDHWSLASEVDPNAIAGAGFAGAYSPLQQATFLLGPSVDAWTWSGGSWSVLGATQEQPPPRFNGALAYDTTRARIVLFGGAGTSATLGDTWEWSGTVWAQKSPTSGPSPRTQHAMAFDSKRGVTVLFGGADTNGGSLGDTWEWDGTSWTQRTPATGPSPRFLHAMAYDSRRGVTVLFGGTGDGESALSDIWEWDGMSWHSASTSGAAPAPRLGAAMVYDAFHERAFLFGGAAQGYQSYMNDSWTWDGATWEDMSQHATATPPDRNYHALAFDSRHDETVLFGGLSGGASSAATILDDTWTWDGLGWTARETSTTPPARRSHGMAYDATRGVTTMFGGCAAEADGGCVQNQGDTWTYDGTDWRDATPAAGSPSPRRGPALAYDPASATTLLFGGIDNDGGTLNDTWQWDGAQWTSSTPAGESPPPRSYASLAYDSSAGTLVLYGGLDGSSNELGDTWLWANGAWSPGPASSTSAGTRRSAALIGDDALGDLVLFGGIQSAAESDLTSAWFNGAWGAGSWFHFLEPPPTDEPAMVYDSARRTGVLYRGTGSVWELPPDPVRPVALATFSFAAAGATSPQITGMGFLAYAVGSGFSDSGSPGTAQPVPGAALALWDAWSGDWRVLANNGVDALSSSALISYTTASPTEAQRYVGPADQAIHVALFPNGGSRAQPSQLSAFFDSETALWVTYRQ
jgi:hypothetical protein